MSLGPIKPGGFAVGDQLTSAQMNIANTEIQNALDKSVAGDTLAGQLIISATGSIALLSSGAVINVNVGSGILANAFAAIQGTIAGAIIPTVAGGIQSLTANGIQSMTASGISTAFAGGIKGLAPSAIQASASAGIESIVPGGFRLSGGATDWPTFNPARSKSYSFPIQVLDATLMSATYVGNVCQSDGKGGILTGASSTTISMPLLNPHQAATLSSVTIWFFVGQAHASVTSMVFPGISVSRRQISNGGSAPATPQFLSSTNTQFMTAASGAAWFASGNVQALTYTCNQNQTIDNVNYSYYISFTDEHGTNSMNGNNYIGVTANYTAIPDMTFPC